MKYYFQYLIALFIFINPVYVYAYLDPGTGSMLLQLLIGGVVAAMFTIKIYWYKLKSFIKRKLGKKDTQLSEESNNSEDDII